ncbi:MAG: RluA family pseudouridine synthase [Flavobacteriales bacterium]|nr:RluA family pseudouridine synthase [Flavobacteriales bacterium]
MTRSNTDSDTDPEVLYEDNHLIVVNKRASDIVQGDKTGDDPLSETVANYLARIHKKPGKAFIGVTHRIDRPVSGVVLFTKTSKALSRMNQSFRDKKVRKTYWAVVKNRPEQMEGELRHYLRKNQKQNKSYVVKAGTPDAKEAVTRYRVLGHSDTYTLLEVEPVTGRHHQIRVQLAHMGCPIKGDLKYGFNRSNNDASIHLHARTINFEHPVRNEPMTITAPVPAGDPVWSFFESQFTEA